MNYFKLYLDYIKIAFRLCFLSFKSSKIKQRASIRKAKIKAINYINSKIVNVYKYNPSYKYSIISACYNVENYIDDFISSVVHQTVGLENIQLILIDDGSTDDTLKKIEFWAQRFPNTIISKTQENAGQGEARNLGLQYVNNDWVCFADPDDFLHARCLERVDKFIKKHKDICFVSLNIIPYFENNGKIIDSHPLRYKFSGGSVLRKVASINDYITLSASASFFFAPLLTKEDYFSKECKPCFEDALFLNRFLLKNLDKYAAFVANAKYYYRKRSDKSSSINRMIDDKRYYGPVVREGMLKLVEYKQKQFVYPFIQYLLCYESYWHIINILNNEQKIHFLTERERERIILIRYKRYLIQYQYRLFIG